jgi:hypothetical protein
MEMGLPLFEKDKTIFDSMGLRRYCRLLRAYEADIKKEKSERLGINNDAIKEEQTQDNISKPKPLCTETRTEDKQVLDEEEEVE